jgi:hypothetical protein
MPLTHEAYDKEVESRRDFTLRRVLFARKRFPQETPSAIRSLAGVSPTYLDAEIAAAIGYRPEWFPEWSRLHPKSAVKKQSLQWRRRKLVFRL